MIGTDDVNVQTSDDVKVGVSSAPEQAKSLAPEPSVVVPEGIEMTSGSSSGDYVMGTEEGEKETKVARIENLYATVYSFNLFTITDGAIRVIVLLHANALGFSPILIAVMFTLYELAGVITNLYGGLLATRFGLKKTLFTAVVLQILGLVALMLVEPIFGDLLEQSETISDSKRVAAAIYISFCQMWSGISKDFMKISCKTVPKLVTKENDEDDRLYKLVAWVTGLKNSFKGFGHLLGAVLVEFAGFEIAVGILLAVVFLIIPVPLYYMDADIGKGSTKTAIVSWKVFQKPWNVNILSLARFFLFGSRDVWFEIAAPIFLKGILQWPEWTIGLFMGGYIIVYGNLQTASSRFFKKKSGSVSSEVKKVNRWCPSFAGPPTESHVPGWAFGNAIDLLVWGSILYPIYLEYRDDPSSKWQGWLSALLIIGLFVFAFFFAINSAVHSYLIVFYTDRDKAAESVGFYYMANAMGRLIGTILSGVIYQFTVDQFGLSMCLWVGSAFMFCAGFVSFYLRPQKQG